MEQSVDSAYSPPGDQRKRDHRAEKGRMSPFISPFISPILFGLTKGHGNISKHWGV
jgi:hypothetical protein